MSRRARFALALAVTLGVSGALAVIVASDDAREPDVVSSAPRQSGQTSCTAPSSQTPDAAADPASPRPAAVAVPGSQSIDTNGLSIAAATTAGDATWTVVRDSAATATVGRIGRLDPAAGALAPIVDLVAGCEVTALAGSDAVLWAGTCAPVGATTGAELVEVDPASGAIRQRVAVSTACVNAIAATPGYVVAVTAGDAESPTRVFRVLADTDTLEEPLTFGSSEAALGVAADADAAWIAGSGNDGARLVRLPVDGEHTVVTLDAPNRILGIAAGTLWTHDLTANTLVGRDTVTGAVTSTTTVANLVMATAGDGGVWYQAASTDSLDITIGTIDEAGTAVTVTTYRGTGPDRTGMPFLGTLSVTKTGALLAIQDRLFVIAYKAGA